MYSLNVWLAVFVCVVVPLVAWKSKRWAVVLLAALLFALQLDIVMISMDSAGRVVVDRATHSGGAVREISEALSNLKEAQWPARIALVISGVGLFLLAVIRRPPT